LFDEILNNGFDALHFIGGFSEHIRNLLVCKHPDTVKLLEVSQSVAVKFNEQAKACNVALMLNALNILNKCELDYKASKNARLHVELCLMKLSHIQSYINLQNSGVDLKKK
jgi:DNA polymerase-3 subunit gamma/tau